MRLVGPKINIPSVIFYLTTNWAIWKLTGFFSEKWIIFDIKMLETMYDKNEFLQLLEYFLFNIIMKQQKCKMMIVKNL